MIQQNNILTFEKLSNIDGLIHGFSTKSFGSMQPSDGNYEQSLQAFTSALGIDRKELVRMNQVHSNTVQWVDTKDRGTIIKETDGILTDQKKVFLGVITGDCIPLLLYDKENRYAAAVHAGWRGVYNEIVKEAIRAFVIKGSNPEDIIVGLGPSIRSCCYEFGEKELAEFTNKFPLWDDYIVKHDGKSYLSTQTLITHQLRGLGIMRDHIEDANHCTLDESDVYSYRKEGKAFGEFIGIIGLM